METRKDQCRKLGCPGCRDCLDFRKPAERKIILTNELRSLELRRDSIYSDLEEVNKKLIAIKEALNNVK